MEADKDHSGLIPVIVILVLVFAFTAALGAVVSKLPTEAVSRDPYPIEFQVTRVYTRCTYSFNHRTALAAPVSMADSDYFFVDYGEDCTKVPESWLYDDLEYEGLVLFMDVSTGRTYDLNQKEYDFFKVSSSYKCEKEILAKLIGCIEEN